MEGYIERMIEERDTLTEKIMKAERFLYTHKEKAAEYSVRLLKQQVLIMKAYENMLQMRIEYAGEEELRRGDEVQIR